jgi:hypothetical protein
MALIPKTKFESAPEGETAAPAPAPAAPVETPVTAVAVAATRAVAVAQPTTGLQMDVFNKFKNSERVDYKTLQRIQAKSSGFFLQDAGNFALGDTLNFEISSFQDSYVASPGKDGPEATKAVRYSDNGVTAKTGEDMAEYIRDLRESGFPDAKMTHRMIVVLDLISAPNAKGDTSVYCDVRPYQMDLPPSSREKFDQYVREQNFNVKKGRVPEDQVKFIQAVVGEVSNNIQGSKKDYQQVTFSPMANPPKAG